MQTAQAFFHSMVEPTVTEFLDRRGDIRRGFFAAIVLNQLADYWARDGRAPSADAVRRQLLDKCPAFAIIRDVADVSKHAELIRKTRNLTTVEQVSSPAGLFQAPFGMGALHEQWVVSVQFDDGTDQRLDDAVEAVYSHWRLLLSA
jgi:hypothetical protein